MSAASSLPLPLPTESPVGRRSRVTIQELVSIPAWVDDLESFRRWAHSGSYPTSGWCAFLDGEIWVDLSMEELLTHNGCKGAYAYALMDILRQHPLGKFVHDRMLLTNSEANLSTEPDGLFYRWTTVQNGRLRYVPGKNRGYMELEGSPDMILEIMSDTSVRKDDVTLRELYWAAGIPEYWLVDARFDTPRFDILRHTTSGYQPTAPAEENWLHSAVLGHAFRLLRKTDPLGDPEFIVESKSDAPVGLS